MNDQLKTGMKLTIVTYLSSFLANKSVDTTDLVYTIIAFLVADFVTKQMKTQINQIDRQFGQTIGADIVGPITMFMTKALLSGQTISQRYIMNTMFVVLGFTVYNIFIKTRLDKSFLHTDLKDILDSIMKPFVMLMVSGGLKTGSNPLTPSSALFHIL